MASNMAGLFNTTSGESCAVIPVILPFGQLGRPFLASYWRLWTRYRMSGCIRDLLQSPRVTSLLSLYLQDSLQDFLLLVNAPLCLVALVTAKKELLDHKTFSVLDSGDTQSFVIWRLMVVLLKNVFEWRELNCLY